jgi:DNA ligase (NAD+)
MNTTEQLLNAKKTYFETGEQLMADDEYDALEEIVRRDGDSAIVDEVGWKPSNDAVKLPNPMPSLKKIKPNESASYFQRTGEPCTGPGKDYKGEWILSEKLDGVSALWTGSKLYMRGNGIVGRDITPYMKYVSGLRPVTIDGMAIRGEICLKKEDAAGSQGPARSQVNGWLHRDDTRTTLKARFIAYQVLGAKLPRAKQFEYLTQQGFEVPWSTVVTKASDEILGKLLMERKKESPYDIDGIVVGTANEWEESKTQDAPKTQVAFKMPLEEQCEYTKVVGVEWNISRLGYLMPRVQIEPVNIGGANINWVTGHNADFIMSELIGPGAVVKIRRSGDVIPIIDTVTKPAEYADMPDCEWTLDGVNAKATEGGEDQQKKQFLHTCKTLKVEGAGPSSIDTLWDYGVKSFRDLLNLSKSKAAEAFGPTSGPKLIDKARQAIGDATLEMMIVACPLARGTGSTKIKAAIKKERDITKWKSMAAPSGWSTDTWSEFVKNIPRIVASIESWGRPIDSLVEKLEDSSESKVEEKGEVCFTGFRDSSLEEKSQKAGYKTASGVKRGLKALIIPDSDDPVTYKSSKADKAREYKITIMRKSDWERHIRNY